jgi:outer membrane protein assembly factor BamA
MRSVLTLLAAVAVCALIAVRYLPHNEAKAAEIQAVAAPSREVKSIAFAGGWGMPYAALRAAVSSQIGEMLDDTQLERDRQAVERELNSRGYLAARVTAPSVTIASEGGAYVVFDIERGPLFTLRSIQVTGPGKDHAGVITLATGDDALGERISRAGQAVTDTLARHGKRLKVEIKLATDPIAATVDVELVTH